MSRGSPLATYAAISSSLKLRIHTWLSASSAAHPARLRIDQRHAAKDDVRSAAQAAQHLHRIVCIGWLAQHFSIQTHRGVGRDNEAAPGLGQQCLSFGLRQAG